MANNSSNCIDGNQFHAYYTNTREFTANGSIALACHSFWFQNTGDVDIDLEGFTLKPGQVWGVSPSQLNTYTTQKFRFRFKAPGVWSLTLTQSVLDHPFFTELQKS